MAINYQISFYNEESGKREVYMNRTEMNHSFVEDEIRRLKTRQFKREHQQNLSPNRSDFRIEVSRAKKCPFCGSIHVSFVSDVDLGERDKEYIVCMEEDCLCEGPVGVTRNEAFENWNKRS